MVPLLPPVCFARVDKQALPTCSPYVSRPTRHTHSQMVLYEPIVFKNDTPPGGNFLSSMTAKRRFLFPDLDAVHANLVDKVRASSLRLRWVYVFRCASRSLGWDIAPSPRRAESSPTLHITVVSHVIG